MSIYNNIPIPKVSGTFFINEPSLFYDTAYYVLGEISAVNWNFGDGNTSSSPYTSATFIHTYSNAGVYSVGVSAFDISGNYGSNSISVSIFQTNQCETKTQYIGTCGPTTTRYGSNKYINLIEYLPQYLRESQTEIFLKQFEDFLNNMFEGDDGFSLSAIDLTINSSASSATSGDGGISVSGFHDSHSYAFSGISGTSADWTHATRVENTIINWPSNSSACESNRKISILEKIKRLTELQDSSLIDIEYIQYFASNLGYSIDINRNEVAGSEFGNLASVDTDNSCSAIDQDKYLRFVVESLPSWYKIKSTNNAIKIMLYSFGLIGDLREYYTGTYSNKDGNDWKVDDQKNLSKINKEWYATPHFAIRFNLDNSLNITSDLSRVTSLINAIESVRPINDVFRRLSAYFTRTGTIYIGGLARIRTLIRINTSDEYPSDYFFQ